MFPKCCNPLTNSEFVQAIQIKVLLKWLCKKKSVKDGHTSFTVDKFADVSLNGDVYCSTLRVLTCEMLVSNGKCGKCVSYRPALRKMYSRWCKSIASPTAGQARTMSNSHANFRYLTTPQKKTRMNSLRSRITSAERKVDRLLKKIEASANSKGVEVDSDLHGALSDIMAEQTPVIYEHFPEGSFKRLFWDQQREAEKCSPRQMRWHPTMIKWCLNIKFRSTSAYEAMRQSGFLSLPSTRTLRDYTHHMESSTGFSPDVTKQLMIEAKMCSLQNYEKHVAVCFDEVRMKEGLVYDKYGVRVIGYVDLGNVNNELLKFEQMCDSGQADTSGSLLPVAKYMLVLMVRGLFIDLNFPFAQFATHSLTSDLLFPIVWEAVEKLEAADFKVVSFAGDGASQNRTFFKMHSKDASFKTKNPYADEPRPIYFFSDVPHLLKTVRNCWANSFCHKNSRALWVSYIIMCVYG